MNERARGLNDIAWERLFERHDILRHIDEEGFYRISAGQIKVEREPRLMAKFDHTVNLPHIFADNGLSILPVTRGDFVISHFETYHAFEPINSKIKKVSMPSYIQSLSSNNVPSEAIALNCAVASGIISDFLEDEKIVSTVSGRMGSGSFSFIINNKKSDTPSRIDVNNSQIEIDAAYEGLHSLSLFEAKRDISDDFIVRQLYYPYRVWRNRVAKPVRPIFLVYSNGIYHLYEYAFEDPDNYSSINLVRQCNYTVDDTAISADDIISVLHATAIADEPSLPFPQANTFERVINICELVSEHELSCTEISEQYAFDPRQTVYYADAARYLGLIEKNNKDGDVWYNLSDRGFRTLNLNYKKRQLALCSYILEHKIFAGTLKLYFTTGNIPGNSDIVRIMKESNQLNLRKETTIERRASTVKRWTEWIVGLIKE